MTDSKSPFSAEEDYQWLDEDEGEREENQTPPVNFPTSSSPRRKQYQYRRETISLVESAFLASTASIIWLIDYYFRFGPFLRILFPLPIALVYLRRGKRAAIITTIVSGLLLTILMGPPRSIIYIVPYGLMGVQLGYMWCLGANWYLSVFVASILGSLGFFFRFWLFSLLLGEDLWVYVISQITSLADWIFLKLGIIARPSFFFIQLLAIAVVLLNNIIYCLTVHLVALLMFDRLHSPIPRPPKWLQVILDYE